MATIKAGTYRFNDVLTAPSSLVFMGDTNEARPGDIIASTTFSDGVDFETVNLQCIVFLDDVLGYISVNDTQVSSFAAYTAGEGWLLDSLKTITIHTDQEVSTEFAEWFTANAAPVVEHTVSGVWKFKDVLTQGGVNGAYANIDFTVTCDLNIPAMPAYGFGGYSGTHIFTCTCISQEPNETGVGSVSFDFETAEPALPDSLAALGISVPSTKYVYQANAAPNGWDDYASMMGEGIKTIDFGTEPQIVSAEFYNWLTVNATQPMTSITHNGEAIASLFPGQTATLKCAGMKMAGDVVVAVAEQEVVEAVEDYDGTITIV